MKIGIVVALAFVASAAFAKQYSVDKEEVKTPDGRTWQNCMSVYDYDTCFPPSSDDDDVEGSTGGSGGSSGNSGGNTGSDDSDNSSGDSGNDSVSKGNASANNGKGGNYDKTGHSDNGKGQGRNKK